MAWDLIKQEVGTFRAGEDMTAARGRAVAFNALERWQIAGLSGPLDGQVHGILTNSPENGKIATVQVFGIAEGLLGGTVTAGRYLDVDANGALIENHPEGAVGIALQPGVAGSVVPVLLVNRAATAAPTLTFGEYSGTFDASSGSFPAAVHQGDWYNVTVAGTVDGQAFIVGDILVALIDAPSTTTFAGNWTIVPNISVTDHTLLTNIGVNTHAQIDTHISDSALHFTVGSIDHTAIQNIGSNSHAAIDSHIADGVIHFTEASIDHGSINGLTGDDHLQYLNLAGRSGGQSAFGSTLVDEHLDLTANPVAGVNAGRIRMNSAVEFGSIAATGAPYAFNYAATEVYTGAFVGGGLNMSGNITFPGGTFIYESFRGAPTINTAGNPGFAAYTVLQALPVFNAGSGAGHNPLPPLILNAGPRVNNGFAGVRTTSSIAGVNFAPTVQGSVAGATMNVTAVTGITVAPKYSTVGGSVISFGTIRGVHAQVPAAGLFQPGAGLEGMTGYYAVDVDNLGLFGGTAPVAAVRSAITAGTNQFFLLNNGNASSDHGAGHIYFDDNAGVAYGRVGIDFDAWTRWVGANNTLSTFFNNNGGSDFNFSTPNQNRFLFDSSGGSTTGEYNFNCARFSIGAQTGAVGNQVGAFVAGARSTQVGGEWADFLLTQAGNITVDHAMGAVIGWAINAPSITLGTGSVVDAVGLRVGGNPNQGTNRYGIHILSNPSGGSGNNYPLYVQNGTSRIAGLITGDPGAEGSGIDIAGTNYDSSLKVSNIGAGNEAQFIMHRHSTTLGPVLVGSRSNSDTNAHTTVADGQDLFAVLGVGWDGDEYNIGGVMRIAVDGTPGDDDMPGRFDFLTTPNGSAVPLLALRINSNQRCDFQTNQALGGGAAATLGTIGGAGPTAAAQATWLEIEIGGVVHWIPAWT